MNSRAALVDALAGLDPPRTLLRILAFFATEGLQGVEEGNREALECRLLAMNEWVHERQEIVAHLRTCVDRPYEFDTTLLVVAMALDTALCSVPDSVLHHAEIVVGDQRLQLRRRCNPIASRLWMVHPRPTGARDQGGDIKAYVVHHVAFPLLTQHGLHLRAEPMGHAKPFRVEPLLERLRDQVERDRVRIRMDPLADLELHEDKVSMPVDGSDTTELRVESVQDLDGLRGHLEDQIRRASIDQVTLLILPELCVPQALLPALKQQLEAQRTGYPVLTIVGACHRPANEPPGAPLLENAALLLDARGRELFVHRKAFPFGLRAESNDWGAGIREPIRQGRTITVLESPLGNLCILICLDFFHARVRDVVNASHATVFAVPSLSAKLDPHERRASEVAAALDASTFIVNHWPHRPGVRYRVPVERTVGSSKEQDFRLSELLTPSRTA